MFDKLRDGTTIRAEFVNSFGTAENLRKEIADYERKHRAAQRTDYATKKNHTLFLMWASQENMRYRDKNKHKTDDAETAWSVDVIQRDRLQRSYVRLVAKRKKGNRRVDRGHQSH